MTDVPKQDGPEQHRVVGSSGVARRRRKLRLGGLAVLMMGAAFTASARATAHEATGPCAAVMDPNNAPSTDPRIEHISVAGTNVNVLLPPAYHQDHDRRYPVVYLFHGAFSDEDSFTTQTDLLSFTAGLPSHLQAVVVMPDGGHLPAGRDWTDGTHPQETYVIGTLLPYIDAHYRTIGDGGHRAAAGFSAGGLDATVFAARHPELFAAAGSFSGFLDPYSPDGQGIVQAFVGLEDSLCGGTVDPNGIWGDPVLHPMGWIGHDSIDLARSLDHVSIYISSGNGTPCADEVDPDPFLEFAESVVYSMSQGFDASLTAAGVEHVTRFRSCGIHDFSNSNQDLQEFWPQMFTAFGRHAPETFDYRTGDGAAAAWGWSFSVSPARAAEFLDASKISDDGLTLTGSGSVTVTTAPVFGHHQHVRVTGGGGAPIDAEADDHGQITFTVNLGAPHTLEEFTPDELAAQASNPQYFTTRTIAFDHGDGGCDDDHGGDGQGDDGDHGDTGDHGH